jgi:hypothetical protein
VTAHAPHAAAQPCDEIVTFRASAAAPPVSTPDRRIRTSASRIDSIAFIAHAWWQGREPPGKVPDGM